MFMNLIFHFIFEIEKKWVYSGKEISIVLVMADWLEDKDLVHIWLIEKLISLFCLI